MGLIEDNDAVTSITLTTLTTYSDYGYSIIMGPVSEVKTLSFAEILEKGYVYSVTDTKTLSVEIPLTQNYFFITRPGEEGDNILDSAMMIFIQNACLFSFTLGEDTYYDNIVFNPSNSSLITDENNADFSSKDDEISGPFSSPSSSLGSLVNVASYIGYALGRDKVDFIDKTTNTIKLKLKTGFDISLYVYDEDDNRIKITMAKDGTIELPVYSYMYSGFEVEFYSDMFNQTITVYVELDFADQFMA